jgi:hypothetical protein
VIRFLPLVLAGLLVATMGSMIKNGHLYPKQPSDTPRTPTAFCQEVAYEVNLQAYEGMISPTQARQIVDRCYQLYVGKPNV